MQPLTGKILADAINQSNEGREAIILSGSNPFIKQLPGYSRTLA